MARTGRPKAPLILTEQERQTLVRWARRAKSSQALALRCRIVLACATGATNNQVAAELGGSLPTVGQWRSRFVARRLEGLVDAPRPGAPRTITDEQVEAVVVATLEETPRRPPTGRGRRWPSGRAQQVHRGAELEGGSAHATPERHLQAVQRPAVHRQGPRRGRAVAGPTGAGAGAVRG
jgi:transposase